MLEQIKKTVNAKTTDLDSGEYEGLAFQASPHHTSR
jgi:hypothetical protein